MSRRDRALYAYDDVVILGGLRPEVLARLPEALEQLLLARPEHPARVAWPTRRMHPRRLTAAETVRAVRASVHVLPTPVTDASLAEHAHHVGYAGLPVTLTICGDRLAVLQAHGVQDGSGLAELVHDLIDAACGLPLVAPRRPLEPAPVRAALRGRLRPAIGEFRRHRRNDAAALAQADMVSLRRAADADASLWTMTLDAARLTALRTIPREGGRLTLNQLAVGLLADALGRANASGARVTLWMPVDQRFLVPGRRVEGNFVWPCRIGTLDEARSAAFVAARLRSVRGGSGVVGLAVSSLPPLPTPARVVRRLARLRRRSSTGSALTGPTVSLSALVTSRHFPQQAWITGRPDALTIVNFEPVRQSAFVFVWHGEDELRLSMWDPALLFDHARLTAAIEALLGEETAAAPVPDPRMATDGAA